MLNALALWTQLLGVYGGLLAWVLVIWGFIAPKYDVLDWLGWWFLEMSKAAPAELFW